MKKKEGDRQREVSENERDRLADRQTERRERKGRGWERERRDCEMREGEIKG